MRETPFVRALAGVATWTGVSRKLTKQSLPAVEEMRSAVTELGLPDTAEFERLWWIAVNSDLIDVYEDRAVAEIGPALAPLESGTAEEALNAWSAIAEALLIGAPDQDDLDPRLNMVLLLFVHQDAQSSTRPAEAIAELEQAGLVEYRDNSISLTPLGLWTAHDIFQSVIGQQVPVLGSSQGISAHTLLHTLRSYGGQERAEELAVWRAGRDLELLAQEIADAIPEVSPLSRAVGLTILLEELGDAGRKAAEALRKKPRVGALVLSRLFDRGEKDVVLPDPEDIAWVYVDMAIAAMETGGHPEEILTLLSEDMANDDVLDMISFLEYADHPHTEMVLRFLIDNHPNPRIASAARSLLHDDVRPGALGRRPKKPKKSGKNAGSRKKRRR